MKVAIFASGNGTNFETLAKAFQKHEIPGELSLLFCDQPKAPVLERAKKLGVTAISFRLKAFENRVAYEEAILKLMQVNQIDYIVLAGYMKLIGTTLLAAYPQHIINIHPALLPLFPGLHGIEDAYQAKVTETGVTIHFVDAGMDSGPIIAQGKVKILPTDSLKTLEERVHALEHKLYPKTLEELFNKRSVN